MGEYQRVDDWGISWLELMFSFTLFSKQYTPIKGGGQKADALYWDYCSPQGLLQPSSARSVSKVFFTIQQMILAIHALTEVTMIPSFKIKTNTSLRHFGFRGTYVGLPCRPWLPNGPETAQAMSAYIARLNGSRACLFSVRLVGFPVQFDVGPFEELSMEDRHKLG